MLDDGLVGEAFGTRVEAGASALRHPVGRFAPLRTALADPLLFHEFEWRHRRIVEPDVERVPAPAASRPRSDENTPSFLGPEVALGSIPPARLGRPRRPGQVG